MGEIGKLYVMVDDRLEIKVKVLSFSACMTNLTVQSSIAEDFDISSDEIFKRAFAQASFICSGCLIVNDWRMIKVSQTASNQPAIFQTYYNFLPDEQEADERNLLVEQT